MPGWKNLRGLLAAIVLVFAPQDFGSSSAVAQIRSTAEELSQSRDWANQYLLGPEAQLAFSFQIDGEPSRSLLERASRTQEERFLDENRQQQTVRWHHVESNLEVRLEATVYQDFPVVEWMVYLKNVGTQPTPILQRILGLDAPWPIAGDEISILHHHRGSLASRSDYEPLQSPLEPGTPLRFAPVGGRPSNGVWPYFNLQQKDRGLIVVVGWPGQWAVEFMLREDQSVHITAGQETTRLQLLPGEQIRTPVMVLLFWRGDRIRSQNLWRRWMMAHGMPRPGGKLPPPIFVASSSRAYEEMIGANEENQIMHIRRYLEEGLKIDYWWMDAGWYVQKQGWPHVGTWEVDLKRFPRGLRAISDFAQEHGIKTIVWFEPERVMPDTWLYDQRPQWLLTTWGPGEHPLRGLRAWRSSLLGPDPNVSKNTASVPRQTVGITWAPGRLSFHPGPEGQFSVVRFTAPESGRFFLRARFLAIDAQATTDVHILLNNQSIWSGWVRLQGQGEESSYQGELQLQQADRLDFVVGYGNGTYVCDSTGLEVALEGPSGATFDAAEQFDPERNPSGPWSYGWFAAGDRPQAESFRLYDVAAQPAVATPKLLDLGNEEARRWLTDHIDRLITTQGIGLYRQDFNIDPLPFWRAADAEDRQGIKENQYVCGFLAFWDELRRRHPAMLIDSCASGGRRNDLETMRRAVPLWRSDYAYEPIGHQCMTYGLSLWLPYHGTGTVAYSGAPYYGGGHTPVEPYAFWSNAAPCLGCGIDIREKGLDYEMLRKLYRQFRLVSPLFYGDFYPLTPYSQSDTVWIAWQFDLPEQGRGMIQAFRRENAPEPCLRVHLRGLNPQATYRLQPDPEQPHGELYTGACLLQEGLNLELAQRPAAIIIVYEKVGE